MAHSIDIEATAVALNQTLTTRDQEIQQQLRVGLEFEKDTPLLPSDKIYMAPNVTISNTLQPYQSAFTPNNTETWDSVENTLQLGKVDMEFDIDELEEFWDTLLGEFFQLDRSPDMYDYAMYIMNNVVNPKLMEEMNTASWAGERVDPTPGTPGAPNETWDGYKKKIADAVTAGQLTPIATGALVATTMEEQVRDFCAGLPAAYRFKPGTIYMSATRAIEYAEDYAASHPRAIDIVQDPDNPVYRVDNYNKVIKPCHAMEGSDRMFFSPDSTRNMLVGFKRGESPYPRFRLQVFERKLKVLSEVSRFYGFRYWGHLFVNDQA